VKSLAALHCFKAHSAKSNRKGQLLLQNVNSSAAPLQGTQCKIQQKKGSCFCQIQSRQAVETWLSLHAILCVGFRRSSHFLLEPKADIGPTSHPTLGEVLEDQQSWMEEREKKEVGKEKVTKAQQHARSVFLCVGHSKSWAVPIHKTLQCLREKHGLMWLRISMSHCTTNSPICASCCRATFPKRSTREFSHWISWTDPATVSTRKMDSAPARETAANKSSSAKPCAWSLASIASETLNKLARTG